MPVRSGAWRSARTASAWRRGADDQTVKIWDSATGKELFALKGHAGCGPERGVQPGRPAPGVGER